MPVIVTLSWLQKLGYPQGGDGSPGPCKQNTRPVAFNIDLSYLYKDNFSLMITKLLVTDDTYIMFYQRCKWLCIDKKILACFCNPMAWSIGGVTHYWIRPLHRIGVLKGHYIFLMLLLQFNVFTIINALQLDVNTITAVVFGILLGTILIF